MVGHDANLGMYIEIGICTHSKIISPNCGERKIGGKLTFFFDIAQQIAIKIKKST